ncbi:MAG TPA: hypothetical protein VEI02_02140 [Planctomycetota bacterium]|nr:hypothetical protein [Planctomycetota bacterium]
MRFSRLFPLLLAAASWSPAQSSPPTPDAGGDPNEGDVAYGFYGVYGAGSPSLGSSLSGGDVVRHYGSYAPVLEAARTDLGLPSGAQIKAIAHADDVFPVWRFFYAHCPSPCTTPVTQLVRVHFMAHTGTPASGAPTFARNTVYGVEWDVSSSGASASDGIGPFTVDASPQSTDVREAISWGDVPAVPLFFTVDVETAEAMALASSDSTVTSCDVFWSDGENAWVKALDGETWLGLQHGDELTSLAVNPYGCALFTLARSSPSVSEEKELGTSGCSAIASATKVYGWVPPSLSTSSSIPPRPSSPQPSFGVVFDYQLNLEALLGAPQNYYPEFEFSGLTFHDPKRQELPPSTSWSSPYAKAEGSLAPLAASRDYEQLALTVNGQTGSGVQHVRVHSGTYVPLEVKLNNTGPVYIPWGGVYVYVGAPSPTNQWTVPTLDDPNLPFDILGGCLATFELPAYIPFLHTEDFYPDAPWVVSTPTSAWASSMSYTLPPTTPDGVYTFQGLLVAVELVGSTYEYRFETTNAITLVVGPPIADDLLNP